MIEVKDLTKRYGDRVAVNNISFSVRRGEILGFLGQNGAGKTTTMKIITGFMAATGGSVSVAGFDVFENPMEVKKRIGYLPETPPLYNELLVSEYLSFVGDLRGLKGEDKTKKIDKAVERCQLGDVRNRLIANLSKGYRQRVGIAQAILHDPEVVILDEPTIGLDPKQVSEARSLIKAMRSERTLIYSTHILSEVAATCDRIVVIDRGNIVAQENLNVLDGDRSLKTELVVQKIDENLLQQIQKLNGVKKVTHSSNGVKRIVVESESRDDLMAEISKVVVNSNSGLVRMTPVRMDLEEYYLELIGARRTSV
jgi:ABC-2 type transport system ATP-binding protein